MEAVPELHRKGINDCYLPTNTWQIAGFPHVLCRSEYTSHPIKLGKARRVIDRQLAALTTPANVQCMQLGVQIVDQVGMLASLQCQHTTMNACKYIQQEAMRAEVPMQEMPTVQNAVATVQLIGSEL